MQYYSAEDCFRARIVAAPDHILVATDLTDSDYLMPHVIAQAKACDARVTLFHAIRPTDSLPLEAGAIPYIDEARIDRDVRLMLMGMAREIRSHGIFCEISVRHAYVADGIQADISRTGAGRLIMGTHGRGKLAQIALGSVANDLLASVEIPVFAVGPYAHSLPDRLTPRRILHPVSLVGDYRKSVSFALDLAQTYRAELTLLHVLDPDIREETINPVRTFVGAKQALTALIPEALDLLPPVHTMVACGNVAQEVLHASSASNADWIVLGVDGAFPFWRLRDSTAYKVLAAANCPVVTLRHDPNRNETTVREVEERLEGVIG